MSFAKLFETDLGQILVKQDDGIDGAEVRIFFEPKGLGVCSVAFTWAADDNDTQWKKADSVFDKATKESVTKIVQRIIDDLVE